MKKREGAAKRGPKEELFKIEGNWEDAVALSFQKQKPPGGWPGPEPMPQRAPKNTGKKKVGL